MEPISDWKGRLIGGRYRLCDLIDPDATMSCVYKAADEQGGGWVIVKMIPDSHELAPRLQREAAALKSVQHHRIVRCLDEGVFEGVVFVVLEYLPGEDLRALIKRGRAQPGKKHWADGVSLMLQVLEGLKAMHQAGMVHRDVKPENMMVTLGGVTIIDFGFVRLVGRSYQRSRRLTLPDQLMGSPSYISPEQKQGEPAGAWSDIFACGVILYELLVGEKPFYASTEPEWKAWREDHSSDWWLHNGPFRPFPTDLRVPQAVQEVIWKALAFDPKDRYQTAEEMRLALLAARPFSLWWWVKGIGGKIRSVWRAVWS